MNLNLFRRGILLILFVATSAAATPRTGEIPSLSTYLDNDGQLQLPTDFVGALDPAGYRMIDSEKSLRFVKSGEGDQTKLFGAAGGCDGGVRAMARGADGRVYIGGDFKLCGAVRASGVVSYDPRTRQFEALGAPGAEGVDRYVLAIAVAGNDVYVGGVFRAAGGAPANHVARWDGQRWHALGAGMDQQVNALVADATGVYAGGYFTRAGGQPVNRVARWNGQSWSALGDTAANGVDGPVFALAQLGGRLVVGGDFDQAGSLAVNNLALWDGNAWSRTPAEGRDGVTGRVEALVVDEQDLYVGGSFTLAGSVVAANVARWDGSQWYALGTGVNSTVYSMAIQGQSLTVGGVMTAAGGEAVSYLARWNGERWSAVGEQGVNTLVLALAATDDALYAGGYFTDADGVSVRNLAQFDELNWAALAEPGGTGIDGNVAAVAVLNGQIYVAGEFHSVAGMTANHIARWNGASWSALVDVNGAVGLNRPVTALAAMNGSLFVAGGFTQAGSVNANRIARWDGGRWAPLGDSVENGIAGGFAFIRALAASPQGLYVGGSFSRAGNMAADNVALWTGGAWSTLTGSQGQGTNGNVQALLVDGRELYVGGSFSEAGGRSAGTIARWDGEEWSALGELSGTVRALAMLDGTLYAGGESLRSTANPTGFNSIAAWDGQSWVGLGQDTDIGVTDPSGLVSVVALAVNRGNLYVGGFFSRAGAVAANSLAIWDGRQWTGLGTEALPQRINAIGFTEEGVLIDTTSLVQSERPELQSMLSDGTPAGGVVGVSISQFGSWVAFESSEPLLPTDTDEMFDVYLRNRLTGELRQISLPGGDLLRDDGISFVGPSISADGETVAFSSSDGQVYVANRDGIQRVSESALGEPGNDTSVRAQVLGFGSLVLFESHATNLLGQPDAIAALPQVYLKNIHSGQIQRLSVGAEGEPANGASFDASGSADGRAVVFTTVATNLFAGTPPAASGSPQLVLVELTPHGQRTRYITRSADGSGLGDGGSFDARLTADGRYGVFSTLADNLLPDGVRDSLREVIRFEVVDDDQITLRRVSRSTQGLPSTADAMTPSISDDGQVIAFELAGNDLFPLDGNGTDVVVKSMLTGQALRLANGLDGREYAGLNDLGQISGDGSLVAFSSSAGNLAANDAERTSDGFVVSIGSQNPALATGPVDEPAVRAFELPTPLPANANCPAGYYAALVDDGPAPGFHGGSFGMELLLDEPGDRLLQGGLNFGGYLDLSQPGFAGFNIANGSGESQLVALRLNGNPWADQQAALPVLLRVARRDSNGVEVVFESALSISLAQAFETTLELPPGYYETSVTALDGDIGGTPEGQFYYSVNTRFIDRPGGGFQGGAVVGGYHGEPQIDSVSGFAAFCLATPHRVSARVLAAPSYGPEGAEDLRLRIFEAAEQRDLLVIPGG